MQQHFIVLQFDYSAGERKTRADEDISGIFNRPVLMQRKDMEEWKRQSVCVWDKRTWDSLFMIHAAHAVNHSLFMTLLRFVLKWTK